MKICSQPTQFPSTNAMVNLLKSQHIIATQVYGVQCGSYTHLHNNPSRVNRMSIFLEGEYL